MVRLDSVAVPLRRAKISAKFNPRDFEVVLRRRATESTYSLPSESMMIGDSSSAAMMRAVFEETGLECRRATKVSAHSRGAGTADHTVSVVYFVLVDPTEEPQDLGGFHTSYFNLGEVHDDKRAFVFDLNHRELLYAATGWLKQRFLLDCVDSAFSVESKTLMTLVQNPLHGQGLRDRLDDTLFSFTNVYFKSGALRPVSLQPPPTESATHAAARNSNRDLAGHVELDVVVDTLSPQPHSRGKQTTNKLQMNSTASSFYNDKHADLSASEESTAMSDERNRKLNGETFQTKDGETNKRKASMPTKQTGSNPLASYGSEDLYDAATTNDFADDEDFVGTALAGLNVTLQSDDASDASSWGGGRGSIGVPDSEHPLLDDLNSDFTNPLR